MTLHTVLSQLHNPNDRAFAECYASYLQDPHRPSEDACEHHHRIGLARKLWIRREIARAIPPSFRSLPGVRK